MLMAVCSQIKAEENMKNVLNEKQQCMAAIACLEAKGDIDGLTTAINAGFDAGLTVSEIKEALSQLYAYTGFPRSLNALGTLQSVVNSRRQQGKACEEGKDADPMAEGYDALKQGTEVQTKLSGKPFTYDFAPATDYYLKAHLFGDIFADRCAQQSHPRRARVGYRKRAVRLAGRRTAAAVARQRSAQHGAEGRRDTLNTCHACCPCGRG